MAGVAFGAGERVLLGRDHVRQPVQFLGSQFAIKAIVKKFEELGITTVKMGGAEFTQFVAKQVADWGPAIKAADVKP